MKNSIDYNVKVLSVRNLRKYFKVGVGKSKIIVPAIDDISFDVYKGEIFGLVGESGCGKTTTGRTIIKLYDATDGVIKFTSKDGKENIIGAGYSGNLHRIQKAKKKYLQDSLQYRQFSREKYEKRVDYAKKYQELAKSTHAKKAELAEIHVNDLRPYNQFIEDHYQLKQAFILQMDDIKFECVSNILKLKQVNTQNVSEGLKHEIKFLKNNHKLKLAGLKDSAGLSKEKKAEEIALLNEIFSKKLSDLEAQYRTATENKIKKVNVKPEIKNAKEKRNAELKEAKRVYKKQMLALQTDFYLKTHKSAPKSIFILNLLNKLSKTRYRLRKSEEKQQIRKDIRQLTVKKANLRLNRVFEIIKTSVYYVFNFRKYSVDREKLAELKLILKQTVSAEKQAIKDIKKQNNNPEIMNTMKKIQMIFQDPIESLNPRMTVKEIIAEGLVIQGIKDKAYIDRKVEEMLELVGLSAQYMSRYPHEFSGGQRQRIGVARALIVEPELIIADEPISALDVSIQAQVINLLSDLKEKLGLTILFVAHDLSVIKYLCDRTAVMYAGKIVETGVSEEVFDNPIHPYTKALLSAIPQPDPILEKKRLRSIYNVKHDYSTDKPMMREVRNNHFVYCNEQEYQQYKREMGK